MSADRPGREVAYRLFAAEYDDANVSHTESDEERAPNYVVTPTGARVNRIFVVGTLTEVTSVNDEMVRARVVDPTGAFVVYAGQYQPDQLAFLERADPPLFVAVTGKARTFQPEDSDRVYTSVRPESIATVDADTRDRWVVGTAEQTIDRIAAYARGAELDVYGDDLAEALLESGLEAGLAKGIPLAQDHYGTTPAYLEGLSELALDAVRVVAGERDQVRSFDRQPDAAATDAASFGELSELGDFDLDVDPSVSSAPTEPAADAAAATGDGANAEPTTPSTADAALEDEPDAAGESGSQSEAVFESENEADSESDTDVETEPATTSFDESTDVADAGHTDAAEEGAAVDDGADGDELGDFEASEFGEGMYQMDDEEREELEAEFGAEFSTGTEVDGPGEADIDVPEPELETETGPADDQSPPDADDPVTEVTDDGGDGASAEPAEEREEPAETVDAADEDESDDTDADDAGAADDEESVDAGVDLEELDLQEYVVETMTELDDGEGADRAVVVSAVVEDTGAPEADVEEAIQDALMGGRCYEPDDGLLKAI